MSLQLGWFARLKVQESIELQLRACQWGLEAIPGQRNAALEDYSSPRVLPNNLGTDFIT